MKHDQKGTGEGGRLDSPLDHIKHIAPRHGIGREVVALFEAAK